MRGAGQTGRPEVGGMLEEICGSVDPGPAHWKEKAAPETEGQRVGVALVPHLALPHTGGFSPPSPFSSL